MGAGVRRISAAPSHAEDLQLGEAAED